MVFHIAEILSCSAYLALCLLAAGMRAGVWIKNRPEAPFRPFPAQAPAQPERKAHKDGLRDIPAVLIALSAWLGIPYGTLPAFLAADWSGAAALACPALSLWLASGRRAARDPEILIPLRLALALAACAWYARQRGVPGDLLSLDTYVGLPLAGVAEGWAGVGLLLLALGALPLHGAGNGGGEGARVLAASLRRLAWLAVWTCLFLPACPARDLGLAGAAAVALDGLYFWGKLLTLDAAARRVRIGHIWAEYVQTGCAGAGAVLLLCGGG